MAYYYIYKCHLTVIHFQWLGKCGRLTCDVFISESYAHDELDINTKNCNISRVQGFNPNELTEHDTRFAC